MYSMHSDTVQTSTHSASYLHILSVIKKPTRVILIMTFTITWFNDQYKPRWYLHKLVLNKKVIRQPGRQANWLVMKYSLEILLLAVCGSILSQDLDSESISPHEFGCQIIGVLKTSPSKKYNECTVEYPTTICGGYCRSSGEPSRVKKLEGDKDDYILRMNEHCDCCLPVLSSVTLEEVSWPLNCPDDSVTRFQNISIPFVKSCQCLSCGDSPKAGLH